MVAVLCYRVYQVFWPPEPPKEAMLRPPTPGLDKVKDRPPKPGLRPPLDLPGDYTQLYRKNPFSLRGGALDTGRDEDVTQKDLDITLLDIKQVGDRWRARLRTSAGRRWYDEGDQFEQFQLEEIHSDEKTVVVYAERHAKRLTLHMEE